jgi:hypothetical protein
MVQAFGFLEVGWQHIGKKAAGCNQGNGLFAVRVVCPTPEQFRQPWTDMACDIDGMMDHGVTPYISSDIKLDDAFFDAAIYF